MVGQLRSEVSYSKYTVKTQDFSKNEDKDL
jgi:hypothetical protein